MSRETYISCQRKRSLAAQSVRHSPRRGRLSATQATSSDLSAVMLNETIATDGKCVNLVSVVSVRHEIECFGAMLTRTRVNCGGRCESRER